MDNNMNLDVKFIEQAYDEAISYANEQIDRCDELFGKYNRGKVHKDIIIKRIMKAIIIIAIGIVGFIFKDVVFEFLQKNVYKLYELGMLKTWLNVIYDWALIALIVWGSTRIIRIVCNLLETDDASGMAGIKKSIQKEIDRANEMKEAVIKAISSNETINIGNSGNWDDKIISLKNKVDNSSRNYKIRTQIIDFTLCLVASILSAKILYPFIIDSYKAGFTYNAVLELFLCYGIIWVIISSDIVAIEKWYPKFVKPIVGGAFVVFQFFVLKEVKKMDIYMPIIQKEGKIMKSLPKFLYSLVNFINTTLLTRGFVLIALTSLAILLYILFTNVNKESESLKNGYTIPMRGSSDRTVFYRQIRKNSIKPNALATLFIIIAPHFTSLVFSEKIALGPILMFLVVGGVMLAIANYMNDEVYRAFLGKKMTCVLVGFFAAYIILTLTMVPNPGFGALLIIMLQSVIVLFVGAIIVGSFLG